MNEFLRDNYSLLTSSLNLIAAITGVFCLKKYKGTTAIFFIYFLIYIVIIDLIGGYPSFFIKYNKFYLIKDTVIEHNYWWYTLLWIIGAILFFTFYYQKILKNNSLILIVKISRNVFLYFSLIFIVFNWEGFFIRSFPILNIAGALIIVTCVALYFIEILSGDKVLSFYKSINFYISAVILVWWLITTPIVFFQMYNNDSDWNFVFLKWQIYLFSNCFMYLTFTFALLWCNPKIN